VKILENSGLFNFQLYGTQISKVEIVGVLLSIIPRSKGITYYVDDGTETIRCVKYVSGLEGFSCVANPELGATVCVQGKLALCETNSDPYGFMVSVINVETVDDPNYETFHWIQCMHQLKDMKNKKTISFLID